MVREFETALVEKYIPYLVPQVKAIKVASSDDAFYWDAKKIEYPSVLMVREDSNPALCERYTYLDPFTAEVTTCWPYDQEYTLRVLVEKYAEALDLRHQMRVNNYNEPYVFFKREEEEIHIGVRLLSVDVRSERDNFDDKGALRYVDFKFLSRLVLTTYDTVGMIKEVRMTMRGGERNFRAIYEDRMTRGHRVRDRFWKLGVVTNKFRNIFSMSKLGVR